MSIPRIFEKPQFSSNTRYIGVPTYGDEPSPGFYHDQEPIAHNEVNLQSHPQMRGHRSWIKTLLVQGFCALWIAPIAVLLFLNVKGWIIGASAWCPAGKCYPRWFDPISYIPQLLIAEFDHENHNLIGALQLVAKALEVWFIMIATWLVYLVTMFLAGRKSGLPIAYITRPSEFAELPAAMDPLLWRTLPRPFRGNRSKKARLRVWIFVLFTVFLGVICNLMGPAVAVLVIPTLQWLYTDESFIGVFTSLNAASVPAVDAFLYDASPNCTEEHFTNQLWSCTANPFALILDSWIESYTASQYAWNGISQQHSVSFAFNSTEWSFENGSASDYLSWAPSRQSMIGLSYDLLMTEAISRGFSDTDLEVSSEEFSSYVPYNSTVATFLQRNGPVVGVASNMWLGYDNLTWWDTVIEGTMDEPIKTVRCYESYNVANTPLSRGVLNGNYTKCVTWGTGWDNYQYGTFTIEGVYKSLINNWGPSAKFDVWTSKNAAFLPNGDLPAGFPSECLPKGNVVPPNISCDWDSFFAVDATSPMYTRSINVNTVQISSSYAPVDGHPTVLDLMFDFIAYQNFTTYALDPSPISNPLWLATTPDLPMSGTPILVDPAWTLAAWSAENGGLLVANRSAPLSVLHAFDRFWELDLFNNPDPIAAYSPYIDYIALIPIIQTLSLVDYTFSDSTSTSTSLEHPKLTRNARINVWAYGLSSRTSYLGLFVTGLGIIIATFQFFLGLIDRRPYRSPMELLVAALEHAPSEEFMGKDHDERAIARTPFRVEDWRKGIASHFRFSRSA